MRHKHRGSSAQEIEIVNLNMDLLEEDMILSNMFLKLKEKYEVPSIHTFIEKEFKNLFVPNPVQRLAEKYGSIVETFFINPLGKRKEKRATTLSLCKSWTIRHVKMVSINDNFSST